MTNWKYFSALQSLIPPAPYLEGR